MDGRESRKRVGHEAILLVAAFPGRALNCWGGQEMEPAGRGACILPLT